MLRAQRGTTPRLPSLVKEKKNPKDTFFAVAAGALGGTGFFPLSWNKKIEQEGKI